MNFSDLSLPLPVAAAAAAQGYHTPTPVQTLVIPPTLEGSDILGGAPTGTGKTAAFLLPILARLLLEPDKPGVRALILEPTRELALQVAEDANKLCTALRQAVKAGISDDADMDEAEAAQKLKEAQVDDAALLAHFKAFTIIGGEGRDIQKEAAGNIVCATPGRLNEFLDKEWFDPDPVEILVIDEADRMLDLGFKDAVASIVRAVQQRFQTLLFSATLEGPGVREFASLVLNDPFEVHIGTGGEEAEKLPELLSSRAYYAANYQQKFKILAHLLKTAAGKAVIFVKTKDRVGELCAFLRRLGKRAASLNGDMSITERKAALRRFKDNEVQLLVATDVAARGLDVPDTAQVYNFDLPGRGDIYVHRAGRTARAGAKGTVINLVARPEMRYLERIERYTGRQIERRAIKNVCAAFPTEKTLPTSKDSRASLGGKGGFDRKRAEEKESEKKRTKKRWRDTKNKGKPDFAAKRAKKQALRQAKEGAAAQTAEPQGAETAQ